MLSTVGEVKSVARNVWPTAVEVNVNLVPATADSPQSYRLSAIGEHKRLLGRVTAPTLNDIRQRLESQLQRRS